MKCNICKTKEFYPEQMDSFLIGHCHKINLCWRCMQDLHKAISSTMLKGWLNHKIWEDNFKWNREEELRKAKKK